MFLSLELFVIQIRNGHIAYGRSSFDISEDTRDPDDLILNHLREKLAIDLDDSAPQWLIHSTSWRYDHNGRITLTYIFYSDYLNVESICDKSLSLDHLALAKGTNARKPRPENITEENVLAHAIRHFGFLVQADKRKVFASAMSQESYKVFQKVFVAFGGELK